AGMVGPVADGLQRFAGLAGVRSPLLATTVFYVLAVVLLPLLTVGGAAALSRRWGQPGGGTLEGATRFTYTLVPLGFGMWLAHYTFHLMTGYDTVVPLTQRFAADLGIMSLGEPTWVRSCCASVPTWLLPLEILCLDAGLLLSLYAAYRLAPTLRAVAPWALLMLLLFAAGVWVLLPPLH